MTSSGYKVQIYPGAIGAVLYFGILDPVLVQKGIEECLNRKVTAIICDLTQVSHAPSSSISAFINQKSVVDQRNGKMVFIDMQGPVGIVFDMLGFRDTFKFYGGLQEAIRDLISQSGTRRVVL